MQVCKAFRPVFILSDQIFVEALDISFGLFCICFVFFIIPMMFFVDTNIFF